MRITELQIDRFGVWSNLNLPLSGSPVNLIYGPNEAGKSTLMRFIRSMLYGFRREDEQTGGPRPSAVSCAGGIQVEVDGREFVLQRRTEPGSRGRLTLRGEESSAAQTVVDSWLGGTSEEVFRSLYAIGLQELQELATLDGEEVASHLYALSLGPEGRRIVGAHQYLSVQGGSLFDPVQSQGELVRLAKELERVEHELQQLEGSTSKYQGLTQERGRLTESLDDLRRRRDVLQGNLRGRQFLDRAWTPWNRQRELQRELRQLGDLDSLPDNLVEQFDELQLELELLQGDRLAKQEQAREAEREAERLEVDAHLEECRCSIQGLIDRVPEMRACENDLAAHEQKTGEIRQRIARSLEEMRDQWRTNSPDEIDLSLPRLLETQSLAGRFHSALAARSRTVRRYRRLGKRQQSALADLQRLERGLENQSVETHREQIRRRISLLEELAELRREEQNLCRLGSILEEQYRQLSVSRELPPYFYGVMWFSALAGLILFVMGLLGVFNGFVQGGSTVWIAGAVYVMLGLFGGGVAWTLKEQFEPRRWNSTSLTGRLSETDRRLREIRARMEAIVRIDVPRAAFGLVGEHADVPQGISERDVIEEARLRLLELSEIDRHRAGVEKMSRRLARLRDRLRRDQQQINELRVQWGQQLQHLGLSDALTHRGLQQLLPRLAAIQEQTLVLQSMERELRSVYQIRERFRRQVEQVAQRVDGRTAQVTDSLAVVEQLEQRLRSVEDMRRRRQEHLSRSVRLREEAAAMDQRLTELRNRTQELLARAAAADRTELVRKMQGRSRLADLRRQLADASQELDRLCSSEPDLAIVEDDLLQFDAVANRREMESIRHELQQIEMQVHQGHERVGILKQQLAELEQDRRATRLKYDRDQLAEELRRQTERWMTLRLAAVEIDRLREQVERHGQPQLLRHASDYLSRLTLGKYHNIWAPLGERTLSIDDDQGQSLRVEHLSNGTREQLFLAVRLAMVRSFADQGIRLPMVLDDVFVNFDQIRTEAAVDTLLDYASRGQQVLFFTCHLHLLTLFESRGATAVRLPEHISSLERQAG